MNKKADRVRFTQEVDNYITFYGGKEIDTHTESAKGYTLTTRTNYKIILFIYDESSHKNVYSIFGKFLDTNNLPQDVNNKYSGKHNFHETGDLSQVVLPMMKQYIDNIMDII